jgi:predicted porin
MKCSRLRQHRGLAQRIVRCENIRVGFVFDRIERIAATLGKLDASGGTSKPNWQMFGLVADNNVSKRTDVYIQATAQKVNGHTGTALDQAYLTAADDSSSNDRQLRARVGIRHKFQA